MNNSAWNELIEAHQESERLETDATEAAMTKCEDVLLGSLYTGRPVTYQQLTELHSLYCDCVRIGLLRFVHGRNLIAKILNAKFKTQ